MTSTSCFLPSVYTPNIERLWELEKNGYLRAGRHAQYDLLIWNYTTKTQYEGAWDEDTLNCRGLVTDSQGRVHARAWRKFFNYDQVLDLIPDEPFEVYEKLDGSLGILFRYELTNELIFCSRGSFQSEQAEEFQAIWKEKYAKYSNMIQVGQTYLFEVLYPANRIVLNYGQRRDCVKLGMINVFTGEEHDDWRSLFPNIPKARKYHFDTLDEVLVSNLDGEEGYVVRFQSGFRCKIKFREYCRLHALITNSSTTSIWECMMLDTDFESLLDTCPDEFHAWVRSTKQDILAHYQRVWCDCREWLRRLHRHQLPTRKRQYEWVKNYVPAHYVHIVMAMHDSYSVREMIYKLIKPKHSRPWSDNDTNN